MGLPLSGRSAHIRTNRCRHALIDSSWSQSKAEKGGREEGGGDVSAPPGARAGNSPQATPPPPVKPRPHPPDPATEWREERAQRGNKERSWRASSSCWGGHIPNGILAPASRPELCSILLQRFPSRALSLTAGLLRRLGRPDLVVRFQLPPDAEAPSGWSGSNPRALPPPAPPRRLTERELMRIAQKLGREWQEVGIACLGLEQSRLEQIRADQPHSLVLQSFEMLREWSRRHRAEATAPLLRASLARASVDPEVFELLQE
ncbi:LOW QUALITY PROTEIN: uncharacterized protein AAGF69_014860 [Amazona ochrocephala]